MNKKISETRRQFSIKNELNSCTNFLEFNLNEFSFDLFFLLVTQIDSRNDSELYTYSITIKELEKIFNKKRINKETIAKSAKELLNVKLYSKVDKRTTYANLFSVFTFDNNVLEVRIDTALLPFFTTISKETPFFKGYLDEFIALKSNYAKRLYLIMRQNLNRTYNKKYMLDELFIDTFGMNDEAFKSLNRRILKPTLEEINKNTSLNIDLILIKEGQKVIGIEFNVTESKKIENTAAGKQLARDKELADWIEDKGSLQVSASNKKIIEWASSEDSASQNLKNWMYDVANSEESWIDQNDILRKIEHKKL